MAGSVCGSKLVNRTSLSFLKSALKSRRKIQTPSLGTRPAPARRFSSFSGLPAELGCVQSLLPLHSAVAVARLTSCLTASCRSCRSLSQVIRIVHLVGPFLMLNITEIFNGVTANGHHMKSVRCYSPVWRTR